MEARLSWGKERISWSMDAWARVIWTDEACVVLRKNSSRIRVWRKRDEQWDTTCLAPTFQSGRISVMIWGCMVHGKLGPLLVLPRGRMDGHEYVRSVMDGPLWQFYCQITEERGIALVMEDGAPIHRSLVARWWREINDVNILPWPAQSPDLNPIEHIWKVLKTRICKHKPPIRTEEALRNALEGEWRNISAESVCNVEKYALRF